MKVKNKMKTKNMLDIFNTVYLEWPEYEFYEMKTSTNLKTNERSFIILFKKDDTNWLHIDLDKDCNMTDSKIKTTMWL